MIVDVQTRIWSSHEQLGRDAAQLIRNRQGDRWTHLDASTAAHEQAMSCVDAAVVLGFHSERLGACIPPEFVAAYVRSRPERCIGVAGIDPMAADAHDQLLKAVDLGLVGVAVSPVCQGFHPTHSAAMRLYEACVERHLPLFVCRASPLTAASVLEFGRPAAWDEVARSIPTLPIVIGEVGFPWIDEALVLAGKHPHVYAEISGVVSRPWQLYNALQTAASLGVIDKLLFGSGFPHGTPAKAIETLYSLNNLFSHGNHLPSIPRPSIRAMIERDVVKCLGIEALDPGFGRHAAQLDAAAEIEETESPLGPGGTRRPSAGSWRS